ncbi:MAG TPA: biotin/lipoyl-containing protein [Candidatus Limnocylindria bacterium]|nr:biotin/lipoyl-containing protein [Candidatus Limnocylindria bacterium]
MSDTDHVLGLVDDLVRLLADSPASTIEVESDGFAVTVTRRGGIVVREATAERAATQDAAAAAPKTQKVHAANVGIFSGPRTWNPGDKVTRGEVLGGVQTLGHVSEVKSPADGEIKEVLVTAGAPVEYGQALFVISVH